MVVTAFVPQAIVMATSSADTLYSECVDVAEGVILRSGHIDTGSRHLWTLGERVVMTAKALDQTAISTDASRLVETLNAEFDNDKFPPVDILIQRIKELIALHDLKLMAHVAGYDADATPHVYEIMGHEAWRVNTDDNGKIYFNIAMLERHHIAGRLLRPCRMANGEIWENLPGINLEAELQSPAKAEDTCRALVNIGKWLESPLDLNFSAMPRVELAVITRSAVSIRQ